MSEILTLERIKLQATATDKLDAIRQAGALLVESGCVEPAYVDGMLAREASMSTYLGNGVAIPHGMFENIADIKQSGICVLQLPDGVLWDEEDDEMAYLVVGIAANSEGHVGILMNLAEVIEEEETADLLAKTPDADVILSYLNREAEMEEDE